jgi:hypothetical protein
MAGLNYNNDVDWMRPELKGWLTNDGNDLESPMKSQVSQYQGLGDMMSKGVDESNKFAGRVGKVMAKPGMPTMLSGLGQMVLAGGGVQNMPINAIANGINKMATTQDNAKIINKGNLIPPTQRQPMPQRQLMPQSLPMQNMSKLNPATDYTFGSSRLKSLNEFDSQKEMETPSELALNRMMKLGFRR